MTRLGTAVLALVISFALFIASITVEFKRYESLEITSAPKVRVLSPFKDVLDDYRIQIERMQLIKSLKENVKGLTYLRPNVFVVRGSVSAEDVAVVFRKEVGVKPKILKSGEYLVLKGLGVKVMIGR